MRFAIAVLLLAAPFAVAEEPKSWKGEMVLPKKWSTEITFVEQINNESKVKYEYSGNAPVKVIDDMEGWLKIRDGTQEGWTPKQEWVLDYLAVAFFSEQLKANPNDVFALYSRARDWKAQGEYDKAIKDYTECIRLEPKASMYYISRGNAWQAKGDHDEAIKDFDEAIRLDPDDALVFNNRGNSWSKKKEYDKAINDYTEALRLAPKYIHALANRARVYPKLKKYAEAGADYEAVMKLGAVDWMQLNYAQLLATCPDAKYRDGAKALKLAKAVIEKAGAKVYWEDKSALAAALAETGDFDGAVKEQKAALADKSMHADDKKEQEARLKLYEAKKPFRDE